MKKPVLILMLGLGILLGPLTHAATPNYATTIPGVVLLPLHFEGQFTASQDPITRFKLPFAARLIGISVNMQSLGGSSKPTYKVDVENSGSSVLSAPITVSSAATVTEGVIAKPVIVDESVLEITLTLTGTSPTVDDMTVLLTLLRI